MNTLLNIDIAFLTIYCFYSVLFVMYFFIYKRNEFITYAFYLLALSFYYVVFSVIGSNLKILEQRTTFQVQCFQEIIASVIVSIYTLFIIQFLDIKNTNKKLYYLVCSFLYFNVFTIPLITIFYVFNIPHRLLFFLANFIVGPLGVVIVYQLVKLKIPYSKFILAGTAILLLGGLWSIALTMLKFKSTFLPTQVAILMDILLFNFALQKKSKDIEQNFLLAELNKQKAIIEERERIIADLHDDIGASFSSIRLLSDLMQQPSLGAVKSKELATKISTHIGTLSQQVNAIVWSLNQKNDTLQNFIDYTRQHCYNYFENTNIVFHFEIANTAINNIVLKGQLRKNLFLIVKEASHNIIKHSKATTAVVTISYVKATLEISIVDNGIGIQHTNGFGNGLKNISKRVEAVNGKLEIINNNGTTINISCPIF